MKEGVRKVGVMVIGVMGLFFLLSWNCDLAGAKDPDYPTKPITFYISFGAGGSTDLSSRAFCDAAGKYLGQPLIPVNKPGAGGTLTAMAVMTAKPDGYSLGTITPSSHIMAPFSDETPYKDLSGFTLISNFGSYIYPLMVRGDAPWKTWKEFMEWAKKNPRAAKIASTGAKTVTSQGLVLSQVEKREKVELIHISFKSSAECLTATLGGHVPMYGSTVDPATVPYIKDGRLKILAYQGINKFPGHEDAPSFQELYGFSIPNLLGVIGPKGLPDYVLKKLDDGFAKAVKDPDFVDVMTRMYIPVLYMNRVQMNKYVEETFLKAGEIMKMLKAEEAKEKK